MLVGVDPFCPWCKASQKQLELHKNPFSPLAHGRNTLQNVQRYGL